jgi:hypothetical protein
MSLPRLLNDDINMMFSLVQTNNLPQASHPIRSIFSLISFEHVKREAELTIGSTNLTPLSSGGL